MPERLLPWVLSVKQISVRQLLFSFSKYRINPQRVTVEERWQPHSSVTLSGNDLAKYPDGMNQHSSVDFFRINPFETIWRLGPWKWPVGLPVTHQCRGVRCSLSIPAPLRLSPGLPPPDASQAVPALRGNTSIHVEKKHLLSSLAAPREKLSIWNLKENPRNPKAKEMILLFGGF